MAVGYGNNDGEIIGNVVTIFIHCREWVLDVEGNILAIHNGEVGGKGIGWLRTLGQGLGWAWTDTRIDSANEFCWINLCGFGTWDWIGFG